MFSLYCIAIFTCGLVLPTFAQHYCPRNQVWIECAPPTSCQATCANQYPTPCQTFACTPGCVCRPGFVKDGYGNCVNSYSCQTVQPAPVPATIPTQCPKPNQVWKECGTACEKTCSNPNPGMCTMQCKRGCFCEDGYVKDANGNCVSPRQCPTYPQPQPQPQPQPSCGRNEEYVSCPNPCPSTCQNPGRVPCTAMCRQFGCQCKSGYVRHPQLGCIHPNQCPGGGDDYECGPNEMWSNNQCVRPRRCQVPQCPNNPRIYCPETCTRGGCVCKPGLMRNANGQCVQRYQCGGLNFDIHGQPSG